MNKRYQVFVSSTYADLKEERQQVIQALMEMDCIPAGMELFPAMDDEQFEFIKRVIDDCDYYLLIIGGRYGSVSETGISYTEMEFDYAVSKGMKVVALIHEEPENIPLKKSEQNPELREKLSSFIHKVKTGRLIKFWKNAHELPGLVALSLSKTIKQYPAMGWVRANRQSNTSDGDFREDGSKVKPTIVDKAEMIRIVRRLTPPNILEAVPVGTPREKVRERLGSPDYVYDNYWKYRYKDTEVQIEFNDSDSLRTLVVGLIHGHKYLGSVPAFGDFVLGETTAADLIDMECSDFSYRYSMRTRELIAHVRIGPPGAWSECYFGALDAIAGHLAFTTFEWDQVSGKMISAPANTVFNWIGIGTGSNAEPPYCDWFSTLDDLSENE